MNNSAKKIVIDAGHGGSDPGASGNGIIEKDLTLKISKYIYDRLKSFGVDVKLTRDNDETLNPTERVNKILNAFGNDSNVIVVSNHINSGGGDGAEVIYALRNNDNLSKLVLSELEKEGQNIRKSYQRRLPSDPSKDYYFIHRNTGKTEPIIIEYGFLDSKNDDVNQLKNNWKQYGEATVKAILQYLNIPYNTTNNNTYIVKSGDTLWNIAKRFNMSVDELKKLNNLSNSLLSIGQILIISNNKDENLFDKYIVKKGDSLYKIASLFNISVDEIMKINNLTNTLLSINQELLVPKYEDNFYKVKKGDTLYKIANLFNTSVDEIIKLNNLTNNFLSIDQIIKIK